MGDMPFLPGADGQGGLNFTSTPPEVQDKAADFGEAGQAIGSGFATSGFFAGLFKALVSALQEVIAWFFSWLIKAAFFLVTQVMQTLTKTDPQTEEAYAQVTAATLEHLFDVRINPADLGSSKDRSKRTVIAQSIGDAIIGSLFIGAKQAGTGRLEPSDVAAKTYLQTVTHLGLEGWIESWLADALSYHELEKFGELKDVMIHALGLSRLSRRVLAPVTKILVTDPYSDLLNQTYRPTQLPVASCVKQYFRGELSREDLSRILGRQGWTEQYIDFHINENRKFLTPADLDYLHSRAIYQDSDVIAYLKEQGWAEPDANVQLAMMKDKRIDPHRKAMVEAAAAAFERKDIPIDQFQRIVQTSGLSVEEQTWLIRVAGMKQEFRQTHLTFGELRQGFMDGILNIGDIRKWALKNNMPLDEEQELELILQFALNKETSATKARAEAAKARAEAQLAKRQAAAAKAEQAKSLAPDRGVTVQQAEALVKDGLWTFDQLRAYLLAKNYGPAAIDAIIELLHHQMGITAAHQANAPGVRAGAAAKGLPLATMEKAAIEGIITIDDLQRFLAGHNFSDEDAAIILHLTQHAIDQAAVKSSTKAAAHAAAGSKQISLAELERAARLGLTTPDAYSAALTKAGFDDASTALLVGILNDQIAADKATAGKRAGAIAAGATRGITLQQLEREVIGGIRPIDDYTAELAKLQYSLDDQRELTALLQLKVDQAAATAEKRTAAGQALRDRGVSLTQAERAVKLGVIPITTYQAQLKAAEFSQDAIDVLSNTLLAETAKVKQTQNSANKAAAGLASKGVSLQQLEKAVIAGVQPIADYTAALIAGNYTAAAAQTLTELLQLKVDQAAAAAERHADAEGKATEKGLNLAQVEAGVIAGDLTMENFDAFLASLGYDELDRSVLASLLQAKVAAAAKKSSAAAAKSGSATPGPAPGPA